MREISISITYETCEDTTILHQIERMQHRFVPDSIMVNDIQFEKEWLPEKTKITFKGVEK